MLLLELAIASQFSEGVIATLKQALSLAVAKLTDPKYREMAKTDADFDRVRDDDRFQALLGEQIDQER